MLPYKLPIAGTTISVTNTATRLLDLINTAASATIAFPYDLSCVQLSPEDGDIRYSDDGIAPTSTAGKLILQSSDYTFNVALADVMLIRAGGANVKVNVRIGWNKD